MTKKSLDVVDVVGAMILNNAFSVTKTLERDIQAKALGDLALAILVLIKIVT